jgi:predicted hydrocarbon binding protein
MSRPLDLSRHGLLALTRTSLFALRAALLRDGGPAAAACLQEAGYAGGETLLASFEEWARDRGEGSAGDMELETFQALASEYFQDTGWGTLELGSLGSSIASLDSRDWAEADPGSGLEHASCYITSGMFASFFAAMAESPLTVLEVECRSSGSERCRFLLGTEEALGSIYQQMTEGVGYEEAAASLR